MLREGEEEPEAELEPELEVVEVCDGAAEVVADTETAPAAGREREAAWLGADAAEETTAAADDTGAAGETPAPPPNLAAKHCAINGTSVSPLGTRERTYEDAKDPAAQPT